ncbi:hypothetical protein [Thiohalorhabdus methylotrophus]|uniref:Uncharacterized protein n=1 Tax=Thiohalorhabdus methylotrophus TaxID=3242694 RepID=A0ABV4TRM6_9GAMM
MELFTRFVDLWDLGPVVWVGAVGLPALYLLLRQLKRFWAWATRSGKGPRERKAVFVPFAFLVGLWLGGWGQSFWEAYQVCRGRPDADYLCIFKNVEWEE